MVDFSVSFLVCLPTSVGLPLFTRYKVTVDFSDFSVGLPLLTRNKRHYDGQFFGRFFGLSSDICWSFVCIDTTVYRSSPIELTVDLLVNFSIGFSVSVLPY
mmetsp:Transcript_24937/g.53110  ORF Transcript_24937/g.53110 Transcript_24937/m.53110 type:complete len:101 (-) Transcript_24937:298-600(-)